MFAKTTKALVAALVVAGFSLASASAAPTKAEQDWMSRASQSVDGHGGI